MRLFVASPKVELARQRDKGSAILQSTEHSGQAATYPACRRLFLLLLSAPYRRRGAEMELYGLPRRKRAAFEVL